MKITYESNLLIPSISETIFALTNSARVCVNEILYDEEKGIVNINLQRKELTGFKRTFFGGMKPVYGDSTIRALLTIRQVEEMNVYVDDRLIDDCDSCFTLLFGVKLDENQLYLGSVEEAQGITLCQVYIKINRISIKYDDEAKK